MNKKILIWLVLVIGFLLAVADYIYEINSNPILDGKYVERNDIGEGTREIDLYAGSGEYKERIRVRISERDYTDEELKILAGKFVKEIPDTICQSGDTLLHVEHDLDLKNKAQGYPFFIRWNSSEESVIDSTGKLVCRPDCKSTHNVILKGKLSYGDYAENFEVSIKVFPQNLNNMTVVSYFLKEELKLSNEESKDKAYFSLPTDIAGREISWWTGFPLKSVYILVASFVVAIMVSVAWEYDRRQKIKTKERILKREYPGFTERVRLLVISGMTVRNALLYMGRDWDEGSLLHKELTIACNKLMNGIREEDVYEEFGEACGDDYRKLMFILAVNLNQGNEKLLGLLMEESDRAVRNEREDAKRIGQEIGVKLLFPMMLILIVVMAVIILPAYTSFNG